MTDERWRRFWDGDEDEDKELKDALIRNVEAAVDEGSSYIDMMYAAYLRATDVDPEDVALVELKEPDGTVVQYFCKRMDLFA